VLRAAGFAPVEVRGRFDCFIGTSKERTAKKYGVIGLNVFARRPVR